MSPLLAILSETKEVLHTVLIHTQANKSLPLVDRHMQCMQVCNMHYTAEKHHNSKVVVVNKYGAF